MVSIRLYVWNVGNISLIQSGCNVKQRAGYRSSSLVFKACLNRIAVSLWYLSSITALRRYVWRINTDGGKTSRSKQINWICTFLHYLYILMVANISYTVREDRIPYAPHIQNIKDEANP